MAAIIGDFISDPARSIHNMIANPPLQQHRHHPHSSSHETSSSSSASFRPALRQRQSSSSSTATARPVPPQRQGSASERSVEEEEAEGEDVDADESPSSRSVAYTTTSSSGAAAAPTLIPSPPSSSSPTRAAAPAAADNVQDASMATDIADPVPRRQQPSPPSDDFTIPASTASTAIPPPPAQTVIRVRDLAHIQTLARSDLLLGSSAPASTLSGTASPGSGGVLNDPPLQQMKYDVSAMPINDIIEMVAALLTKITTTNDLQHDAMQRSVAAQQHYTTDASHPPSTPTTHTTSATHLNPLSHSVLAFHGKNVPAITIHSYLARIHRYCPTTFEVFLSLLVYFDRMTERVNDLVTRSEEARRSATTTGGTTTPGASARPPMSHHASSTSSRPGTAVLATTATTTAPATVSAPLPGDVTMRDDADDDSDETDSDLADDDDDDEDDEDDDDDEMEGSASPQRRDSGRVITAAEQAPSINGPTTYFVVDSFNIHRLIIAGVTCSSKFFSDVFYTNSRYAKVSLASLFFFCACPKTS